MIKTSGIFVLKAIWNILAVIGIISICVSVFGAYHLISSYDLTPHQLASKVMKKAGIDSPVIEKMVAPPDMFADYQFQGKLKRTHPRILFKDQSQIDTIRQRYIKDSKYKKKVNKLTRGSSAWLCSKNNTKGKEALKTLLATKLSTPKADGKYGNGLDMALKYDLLYDHPDWSGESRSKMHILMRRNLRDALLILNGDYVSLWHGRFQLACATWVVASVLDIESKEDQELVTAAQAHFLEAVRAIQITEGWPEGYNYWINNRAYPYALACLSHMNSVDAPELNQMIKSSLETTGLWTIYGTDPRGRFALFGDSGPRSDLKDETQRVIDLITLGTGNPVFKYFSAYIESLHGSAGYYQAYKWLKPVLRGLPKFDFSRDSSLSDLSFFNGHLRPSHHFGKGAFDQIFIRSGWNRDDTFISYRAGSTFTHHGHYQAGHFSITKFAPLAIKSGNYSGYTLPHRLNYYMRTVASNSLLILKPHEQVKPNRFFQDNVAAGGQRIIIPTGSSISGIENYRENFEKNICYEGATVTAFDNSDPGFVYVKSDLTKAYSSQKAVAVQRELCYLNMEDLLLVHDMVETTQEDYTTKWLLHSWSKPLTLSEKVLKGNPDNGILETRDRNAEMTYKEGKLFISAILPEKSVLRKVGGMDYRYYVETDGDDSDLNGENMVAGAKEQPWFDSGLWRIELQSSEQNSKNEFLVLLKPGKKGSGKAPKYQRIQTESMSGIQYGKKVLLFLKDESTKRANYAFVPGADTQHIVMGLPLGASTAVKVDNKPITRAMAAKGTISFKTPSSATGSVTIEMDI